MEFLSSVFIFFAGLWAGTINSVVGSGTLVTFPVLIALGFAPVTASISNAMGLVAGNAAGAWGYRKELAGRGNQLLKLLPASLLGGITGAYLLLHLPEVVFHYAAPALIVLALLMVVFQPRLQRWVRNREENPEHAIRDRGTASCWWSWSTSPASTAATSWPRRASCWSASSGVFMTGTMQNANAMKNILVLGVNIVAAIVLPALRLRPDQLARRRADRRQLADRRPDRLQGGPPAVPGGPARRHLRPGPRGPGLHDRQPVQVTRSRDS